MSVKLTDDEVKEFLTQGHTLILATIRKSGAPFMTPLWYVYHEGSVYFSTLSKSAKVQHLRRDPRACIMIEEGKKWIDLHVVVANCTVEILEGDEHEKWYRSVSDPKYKDFRGERAAAPAATQKHYAQSRVIVKLTPIPGEVRSWYNRKIRMAS